MLAFEPEGEGESRGSPKATFTVALKPKSFSLGGKHTIFMFSVYFAVC